MMVGPCLYTITAFIYEKFYGKSTIKNKTDVGWCGTYLKNCLSDFNVNC